MAEFVLLLFGEGLTFAEFSLDGLYAVHIVVNDGDVMALLRQKGGHGRAYLPRAGNDDLHSDLSLLF